jgi:hypothetical protein
VATVLTVSILASATATAIQRSFLTVTTAPTTAAPQTAVPTPAPVLQPTRAPVAPPAVETQAVAASTTLSLPAGTTADSIPQATLTVLSGAIASQLGVPADDVVITGVQDVQERRRGLAASGGAGSASGDAPNSRVSISFIVKNFAAAGPAAQQCAAAIAAFTPAALTQAMDEQVVLLRATNPEFVFVPLTISSMVTLPPVVTAVPAPTPAPTTQAPSSTPQPTAAAQAPTATPTTSGSSGRAAATAVVTAAAALMAALLF